VLHANNLDAAKRNLRTFRARFAKQFPEAVACLERGFADATTYFAFPEEHWDAYPLDERTRTFARRDQASHPRHRRVPVRRLNSLTLS